MAKLNEWGEKLVRSSYWMIGLILAKFLVGIIISLFRSHSSIWGGSPYVIFLTLFNLLCTIPVYVLQFIYIRMMGRLEIGTKELKKTASILIVTLCFDLANTLTTQIATFVNGLTTRVDFIMFPVTLLVLIGYIIGYKRLFQWVKEKQTLLLEEINTFNWVDVTMQRLMSVEMKHFTYLILIGAWVSFFGGIFIHFMEIGKYVILVGALVEAVGILKIGKLFSGEAFEKNIRDEESDLKFEVTPLLEKRTTSKQSSLGSKYRLLITTSIMMIVYCFLYVIWNVVRFFDGWFYPSILARFGLHGHLFFLPYLLALINFFIIIGLIRLNKEKNKPILTPGIVFVMFSFIILPYIPTNPDFFRSHVFLTFEYLGIGHMIAPFFVGFTWMIIAYNLREDSKPYFNILIIIAHIALVLFVITIPLNISDEYLLFIVSSVIWLIMGIAFMIFTIKFSKKPIEQKENKPQFPSIKEYTFRNHIYYVFFTFLGSAVCKVLTYIANYASVIYSLESISRLLKIISIIILCVATSDRFILRKSKDGSIHRYTTIKSQKMRVLLVLLVIFSLSGLLQELVASNQEISTLYIETTAFKIIWSILFDLLLFGTFLGIIILEYQRTKNKLLFIHLGLTIGIILFTLLSFLQTSRNFISIVRYLFISGLMVSLIVMNREEYGIDLSLFSHGEDSDYFDVKIEEEFDEFLHNTEKFELKTCSNCDSNRNLSDSTYCASCGELFGIHCPHCGYEGNASEKVFCEKCKQSLISQSDDGNAYSSEEIVCSKCGNTKHVHNAKWCGECGTVLELEGIPQTPEPIEYKKKVVCPYCGSKDHDPKEKVCNLCGHMLK